MSVRKKAHSSSGHGWYVSFADLMSLLMAFFVMLLSMSNTEEPKFQQAVGSIQDAFGMTKDSALAGIIERNGNPQRDVARSVSADDQDAQTEFSTVEAENINAQGQEADTTSPDQTDSMRADMFSLAAATLKQSFQDRPDITTIADNLIVEADEDGINIIISNQTGAAMFPEGSKFPFEATRKAIAAMAPALAAMPNQLRIQGFTAAGSLYTNDTYGPWELSFDRANVIRQILSEFGVPKSRFQVVAGRGESEPFFPNDPYLAANERVAITLLFDEPPVPIGMSF